MFLLFRVEFPSSVHSLPVAENNGVTHIFSHQKLMPPRAQTAAPPATPLRPRTQEEASLGPAGSRHVRPAGEPALTWPGRRGEVCRGPGGCAGTAPAQGGHCRGAGGTGSGRTRLRAVDRGPRRWAKQVRLPRRKGHIQTETGCGSSLDKGTKQRLEVASDSWV